MNARILLLVGWAAMAARAALALPAEVTVTAPAKLELLTAGRPSGSVGLKTGEKLAVVSVADDYVVVRYRALTGRVLAAQTDLPRDAATSTASGPQPAAAAAAPGAKAPEPAPRAAPYEPRGVFERKVAGKLVALQSGALRPFEPARLEHVKFYAVYFSASWCGPCKAFTPELVDAYGKIRALYPEFEIILVNRDRSPAAMAAYMRDDRMPWPALGWTAIATSDLNRYAGNGIPCLVLVDEKGKVLSDSYRSGRYVGPDAVLDDTWKILRDYRRQHPRAPG